MIDAIEHLRRQLPEIGDGLETQLVELSRAPTPERCIQVATNLDGARRNVLNLAQALQAQDRGDAG